MGGKKTKKVEEDLIPEESETAVAVSPERDYDAERKDEEVMKEDEIPAANADKTWHHLWPKKVMAADAALLIRTSVLFMALKGNGVSCDLYGKLPEDIRGLFSAEPKSNEDWSPADNF